MSEVKVVKKSDSESPERKITLPKPKLPDAWFPLIDKRIVVQQKRGATVIGTFIGQRDGWFVLENAVVHGMKNRATPERILIDRHAIAHMHEECAVERIDAAAAIPSE